MKLFKPKRMNFKQAEKKLRKLAGTKFYSLQYKFVRHSSVTGDRMPVQECWLYMDDTDIFIGATWELAFAKMEEAINRPETIIENIK